ncbi:hypothetical protein D1F64_06985 [Breoghania sp. L-A4]|nr:hypothetical protein D1F64_06985 [Breoghania sp. L-A4]
MIARACSLRILLALLLALSSFGAVASRAFAGQPEAGSAYAAPSHTQAHAAMIKMPEAAHPCAGGPCPDMAGGRDQDCTYSEVHCMPAGVLADRGTMTLRAWVRASLAAAGLKRSSLSQFSLDPPPPRS